MNLTEAREIAALAWTKEKTKETPMDQELANAFAEILLEVYDVAYNKGKRESNNEPV